LFSAEALLARDFQLYLLAKHKEAFHFGIFPPQHYLITAEEQKIIYAACLGIEVLN
jgi:hypothetical protein